MDLSSGQLFSQMNYEKIKKSPGESLPRPTISPLINSPLIYGIFTPTGRPQSGRQAEPDENPVNQGGIYEGENDPGGYLFPTNFLPRFFGAI